MGTGDILVVVGMGALGAFALGVKLAMPKDKPKTDWKARYPEAEEYRRLIFARTKIPRDMLMCPRERSDMTPCIARDGALAVALGVAKEELCVGCDVSVAVLLDAEKGKHGQG